jgi:ABC-type polysaccharide/polyol phosphate transport system ATPase subunit
MAALAIRAEGLSKRYRIHERGGYTVLRDAVLRGFRGPRRGGSGELESPEGTLWAVKDASFTVERGEVVGIIGRNGSGKSTLLKILARVTPPTLGSAEIHGRVGSLLEVGTGFHPELTGRENVVLNAAVLGMSRDELDDRFGPILEFAEISGFEDTPVKHYSSGMQVRLAFAVAAHLDPEILFVDEVLAVGDLAFQRKCLGKLDEVTRGGRTVLFVSHDLAAVSQLCGRCLVLDRGRVTFVGPTAEAIQRYAAAQEAAPVAAGRRPLAEVRHEKHVLLDPRVRILELGLAAGQAEEVAVGGVVQVEVVLEMEAQYNDLVLGYTVHDGLGAAVLTGWSRSLGPLTAGRHLAILSIGRLPLAPGAYELSLAILTGGLDRPKYVYDMVLRFGRFTVQPFLEDRTPVAEWRRAWGRVIHDVAEVRVDSNYE